MVTKRRQTSTIATAAIPPPLLVTAKGGLRPDPDPTVLTTQQLQREIALSRELVESYISGIEAGFIIRLDAMDKAVLSLEVSTSHRVGQAVIEVKELYAEKFRSVEGVIEANRTVVNDRFTLGDVQTEKAARDVKSAVDAAFAAAKEAVGEQNKSNALSITKSENAVTKQIDQLAENVRQNLRNTADQIEAIKQNIDARIFDIKDRLVAMEGRRGGMEQSWGMVVAGGMFLIGLATVMIMLMKH